jgi:hypothetical protein
MTDEAIAIVVHYMEKFLFAPEKNWPKIEFDRRSYSRWAVNEILELLADHPFSPADAIIDGFIIRMSYFSCLVKNGDQRFIVAIEAAEEIQSILTR